MRGLASKHVLWALILLLGAGLALAQAPTGTINLVTADGVSRADWNITSPNKWTFQGSAPVTNTPTAVQTNAALSALASTAAPYIWRYGVSAAGDSEPLIFIPSGTACSIGGGDGISQVPTSDGGCWNAKFSAPVNVGQACGAQNDTTDNTACIQKAVNAACTASAVNSGFLQFPNGVFQVNAGVGVVIPCDGLYVKGHGPSYLNAGSTVYGSKIHIIGSGNKSIMNFSASLNNAGRYSWQGGISDIGFITNNSNSSITQLGAVIKINHCLRCLIDNVTIWGAYNGVEFYSGTENRITNSNITQTVTGGYGIWIHGSDHPGATATPWAANTAYTRGQFVTNGGNTYQAIVAGTSASSGGPSGVGAYISPSGGLTFLQGIIQDNGVWWQYQPFPNMAKAWTPSAAYLAGDFVTNGGNVYEATIGGAAASSGGPTGTGGSIVDGSVTWEYVAFPNCNPSNVGGCASRSDNAYIDHTNVDASVQAGFRSAQCIVDQDFAATLIMHNIVCEQTVGGLLAFCPYSQAITNCPQFITANDFENELNGVNDSGSGSAGIILADVEGVDMFDPQLFAFTGNNGISILSQNFAGAGNMKFVGGKVENFQGSCIISSGIGIQFIGMQIDACNIVSSSSVGIDLRQNTVGGSSYSGNTIISENRFCMNPAAVPTTMGAVHIEATQSGDIVTSNIFLGCNAGVTDGGTGTVIANNSGP